MLRRYNGAQQFMTYNLFQLLWRVRCVWMLSVSLTAFIFVLSKSKPLLVPLTHIGLVPIHSALCFLTNEAGVTQTVTLYFTFKAGDFNTNQTTWPKLLLDITL